MPAAGAGQPGRRRVVRVVGLGMVVLLAGAVAAMMLFQDRIEALLTARLDEPAPRPQAAVPKAPRPQPGPPQGQAAVSAAEVPAPDAPARDAAVAAATTNIADLMEIARTARGRMDAAAPPETAAAAGVGPRGGPVRLISQDALAEGGPETLAAAAPDLTPVPVEARPPRQRLSVEEAVAQHQRARQAMALGGPVTIRRPAAERAGAGVGVSVSEPSAQARDTVASAYRSLLRGNYSAALDGYDAVLAVDPRNQQALLGRAAALHKLGRMEAARRAYETVLARDPGNREALTNLLAIIATAAPEQALSRLLELERQAPSFTPVLAQIGMLYGTLGQPAEGAAYLERAVRQDRNPLYLHNLAILRDQAGQREAAIRAYKAVLDSLARDPGTLQVSADSLRARLNYLLAQR